MPLLAVAADAQTAVTGLQRDVVFTDYSPFSRSPELLRRLLSPLIALRLQRGLESSGQIVREQTIDLAQEKFAIYVPPRSPLGGYALFVFVPPWDEASVPQAWTSALDRHGMILVSAANSGNAANVLDRREPLALLAAQNITQRYPVDPARVYIGGFSGGSRVALRIALGYADVFRGVLLSAGSDPIGDAQIPLPPTDLFQRFQESTRLVYLTGRNDATHLDMDARSRQSMQAWCVFNLRTEAMPWAAHEPADAAAFDRALDALGQSDKINPDKLADCRARIDTDLTSQLQLVEALLAGSRANDARTLLDKIDTHFGGLAAPRSIELSGKIDARH